MAQLPPVQLAKILSQVIYRIYVFNPATHCGLPNDALPLPKDDAFFQGCLHPLNGLVTQGRHNDDDVQWQLMKGRASILRSHILAVLINLPAISD